jgi:hypothetical protein
MRLVFLSLPTLILGRRNRVMKWGEMMNKVGNDPFPAHFE